MTNPKPRMGRPFLCAFGAVISSYCIFLYFRGFGWDGDSLVNAAQFVKLINPHIYGSYDLGTHPKILDILLFGLVYQFTGSFHLLTILSIMLTALMVGCCCKWIDAQCGVWWIALLGWVINIPWLLLVINCDNPALSIPFLFLALFTYFHLDKKKSGAVLLCVSSLFRPGAEMVLIALLALELIQQNRDRGVWVTLVLTLSVCLANSYWGYLWAYPTKEQFMALCVTSPPTPQHVIDRYRHSIASILPLIKTVLRAYVRPYNVVLLPFAMVGLYRTVTSKNGIVAVALAPLAALILTVGTFIYGIVMNAVPDKTMEFALILPVFAACCVRKDIHFRPKKLLVSAMFLIMMLFSGQMGAIEHGKFQVGEESGDGTEHWQRLPASTFDIIERSLSASQQYRVLLTKDDLIFFILDYGRRARSIDVMEQVDTKTIQKTNYDLVLLPPHIGSSFLDANMYHSFTLDGVHTLWVRR